METERMRIAFTVIFACLIAALLRCAHIARNSGKSIGIPVMHLLLALIPPLAGNLILIISTRQTLSAVGCYIYFLGMDLVMLAMMKFTAAYCFLNWPKAIRYALRALLGLDALRESRQRSDAILIASVTYGDMRLASVLRDTIVTIPDHGSGNTARRPTLPCHQILVQRGNGEHGP